MLEYILFPLLGFGGEVGDGKYRRPLGQCIQLR
jgi:hypothetical protein